VNIVAALIANGVGTCGADDNQGQAGHIIAHCLNAKGGSGQIDGESETFVAHSLRAEGFDASEDGTGRGTPLVPVCFDPTQITHPENRSNPQPGDPCHTLAKEGHPPAVAFHATQDPISGDVSPAMGGGNGHGCASIATLTRAAVRRLLPVECEALQGFPRGYTLIPFRGKPAADGPRYKALGNSMAVPCMRYIGERIASTLDTPDAPE
jgi:DNA (cytosine-5)-methyltransferase 1